VRAHQLLLGRYEYADIDDGLRDHARKLFDLAKRALSTNALGTTPPQAGMPSVNVAYSVMASAYSSLARAAGDFLHADSALMILDEAYKVLGPVFPDVHRFLDGQRDMYMLVGTKATPIDGKWWINAKTARPSGPETARSRSIQFTAHWCKPCKHSYPGMLNMAKHFAGKPVENIMETYLYGYIGSEGESDARAGGRRGPRLLHQGAWPPVQDRDQHAAGAWRYADPGLRAPLWPSGAFPRSSSSTERASSARWSSVGTTGTRNVLTAFIDKILTEK